MADPSIKTIGLLPNGQIPAIVAGDYLVVHRAADNKTYYGLASQLSGLYALAADLADVATSGDYGDLDNLPTLGSAAAANVTDFATAAQGATADTALQPADIGVSVQAYDALLAAIAALDPGAPETGYALTWNGSTIVLSAAAGGASITLDTMANILASTSDAGDMFYATDEERFLIYDGTAFQMASPLFAVKLTAPNIGADYPVVESDDPNGYYREFITNKTLYNSAIGGSDQTTEGGVRLSSGEIQFYLDGEWKTIVTGIRIREDDGGGIFLEFRPTGSDLWINATNGNSDQLDPAGNPVVWGQKADIGAYSSPPIIGGRVLT